MNENTFFILNLKSSRFTNLLYYKHNYYTYNYKTFLDSRDIYIHFILFSWSQFTKSVRAKAGTQSSCKTSNPSLGL